jgi:uncharacterized protein (TIGR02996 family)
MGTEEALLQDVRETPDDDIPRLIYADWLDDHGQPERAEFIRLQCCAARHPEDDLRRQAPEARAQVLLEARREEWEMGLPRWLRGKCRYERGLGEVLHTNAGALLKGGLRRAPLIHRLVLTGAEGRVDELAGCAHLAGIRELSLSLGRDGGLGLAPLLGSSALRSLRRLEVSGRFLREDLEALSAAPSLARLRCLVLKQTHFSQKDPIEAGNLARVLDSPNLCGLTSLALDGSWLDENEAEALSARLGLPQLRELTWQIGRIGAPGVSALVSSPQRQELVRLHLAGAGLSDEGAAVLASSPYLRGLQQLDLRFNGIGPQGAEALTRGH